MPRNVCQRIPPEEVDVLVRGFAVEVIVTNSQEGRGASPIKTESVGDFLDRR